MRCSLRKITYIRVGLSGGQEASALMHTSLTGWAAKSFSLHGRRIVTIISRTLSNSDGRGEIEVRLMGFSSEGLREGRFGNRSKRGTYVDTLFRSSGSWKRQPVKG